MLALPRMSRNEAQARSLIGNRARACPVFVDARWVLTLEPASLACPPEDLIGAWQVQADWSGARFVIELPDYACTAWLNQKMPELEVAALPETLVAAAMEAGIADLVSALRSVSRLGKVRITRLSREPIAVQLPYIFNLLLTSRDGSEILRGLLHADALGLMVVAGLVGKFDPASNSLSESELKLALQARIGSASLTVAEFDALQRQDIILLEECWLKSLAEGGHELSLMTADGGRLRVQLNEARMTVLDSWEKVVSEIPDADDLEEDLDGIPVELEAVPIRLNFDLGERVVTLVELKEMQPGQSFDLGRPLSGPVRIRANGALIGTGELVEIDGHLGVSVLTIGGVQKDE